MSYWKRLYIFEIMEQNHLKWCMCMDVSHNTNHANPQVISFDNDNDKDISDFSISHYAVWCHT